MSDAATAEIRRLVHKTIASVGGEIEGLRFNRAVAQIYELTNGLSKFLGQTAEAGTPGRLTALSEGVTTLIVLVAPMMPHLAEACWAALGNDGMAVDASWPEADPALLVEDSVTIPVQVNGKRRGEIVVPPGAPKELVEAQALSLEAVARMLDGKPPKKLVIVPDRIVNVVV